MRLYTVAEVAGLMHVHRNTVYALISGGHLRAINIATGAQRAKTRIREDDYLTYVETQTRRSA